MSMLIGKRILWRPKGKTCDFMVGYVAQYRLAPARIEIVNKIGQAYGTWIHIADIETRQDLPKRPEGV